MRYILATAVCCSVLAGGLGLTACFAETGNKIFELAREAVANQCRDIEEALGQNRTETDSITNTDSTTEAGSMTEVISNLALGGGIQLFLEQRGVFRDNQPEEANLMEGGLSQPEGANLPEGGSDQSEEANLSGAGSDSSEVAEVAESENEYADLAIADVTNYVNVRSEPNTESSIVGKIYDGAVAHVLSLAGEENDWFQVVSGNVEGYIKAEFFLYGDAAAEVIEDYVTRYALVLADRLNVRAEPDIGAKRIGYIDNGERVKILENLGEWLKVQYTDSVTGYVAAEYVTIEEEFIYAKTLEEEAKELAEKKALEARSRVSESQAAENTVIKVAPPNTNYSTNEELRSQIVEYAMQYLGNKYVHGGQSLAGGTDCSGFTCLIYKEFGYSISRTPEGQFSGAGNSIDYSNAQPGDIICYGSSGKCTHVALYIGDGKIIHAANSRKGVITGNAGYDTILGVKNVID